MGRTISRWVPLVALAACLLPAQRAGADGADWPMLAHDAGRSGATPVELRPPFARKWYRAFPDEGLMAGVQPIVAGGRVYVGTLKGVMHAVDAETGRDVWTFQAGGPILHACAAADGKVFFGSADGKVYAVHAADGSPAWTVATGSAVWNAPAVFENVVYVASRDGSLYAIEANTGKVRWTTPTPDRLVNSPAIDAKNRHVVVGCEDMHVYAFDLATGKQLWSSPKLPGASFLGYHPVIAPDGSALITTLPAVGGDAIQQMLLDMTKEVFGDFASWRHKKEENDRLRESNFALMEKPDTYPKQIEYLRKRLSDQPACQSFFVLDGQTGKQKFVTPVVYAESMNGPGAPAVVTPDGKVIVKYSALLRSRYEHYSPFLNVGYLDTETGFITPVMDQSRTYGWNDSLLLVHDEQSQLSVGGRVLFNTHQDNVNAMDLDTLKGYPLPFANNVHEPKPGEAVGIWAQHLSGKPISQGYEWFARGTAVYGGGSAIDVPVSIAGDSFYYLPTHELNAGAVVIAYRMQKDGDASKRGPEPKEKLTDEQWAKVRDELKWDWDTLEMPRLNVTLNGLPPMPGTRRQPLTNEAKAAVAKIIDEELDRLIVGATLVSPSANRANDARATQVSPLPETRRELHRTVDELISTEWRPLLFPAAKAPSEAYHFFVDPSQTLYTLALAYPHLDEPLRKKVRDYVAKLPNRKTYDPHAGQVRSAYDPAPESLVRVTDDLTRSDTARLYPLWLWAHATGDWTRIKAEWNGLRARINPKPEKDEPDLGNARLAGLIAACRIAKELNDQPALADLLPRTRAALRDRLTYELAHPRGGLITKAGNRTIVGRWRFLTPDLARLLAAHAGDIHRNLMSVYVDHHRPTWWLAWNVEPMWRNEAPLSLPTMSMEVFAARAMILGEKADALARYVDRPWCKGDEFYIQKLALVLDAM